jgi:hypothetical protein
LLVAALPAPCLARIELLEDELTSQIQQIAITEENVHSWLADTPLLSSKGLSVDPCLPGGAKPGDVIFLAQRKKIAEGGWTQLGRLRVQILEHLINKGQSPFSPLALFNTS